jgi:hypothetical protein
MILAVVAWIAYNNIECESGIVVTVRLPFQYGVLLASRIATYTAYGLKL